MRMKLMLVAGLAAASSFAVDLKVVCDKPGAWKIEQRQVSSGNLEEYEFRLSAPKAAVPPCFSVLFEVPQLDAHHRTGKVRLAAGPNVVRMPVSGYLRIAR